MLIQESFTSLHISPNQYQLQYSSNTNENFQRVKRRTTSERFQIHIHYDKSVKKLLDDEQNLIREAVEAATDYWSKAIRPKYKTNDRIRLTRYSNKTFNNEYISFLFFLIDNVHQEKCLSLKMIIQYIIVQRNV